ncbi:MAG: NrfD/PsrC family molybdoenzyme membrane anchor subunit [Nitrospinota bacterium]
MKRALGTLWAALLLVGLYGVYLRLTQGHVPVNYNSYIPWGLWVAVYIYFVGLSAGAFLLSALVYVFDNKRMEPVGKLALFTALVTLLCALLIIWADLGHMSRFYRVYTRPNFLSMMAWMVWLYTLYFLLLLVEFWFAIRQDLARRAGEGGFGGALAGAFLLGQRSLSAEALARDRKVLRVLGALGIPLAIAFHGGVGALFGVVGARAYWHSALYPLLFLISALTSGGALLTAAVAIFWPVRDGGYRELVSHLGRVTLGLLALDLLFEWAEFSINLYAAIPAHAEAFRLVLFGPYWWVFWVVHLGLGAVVPGLILLLRGRSPTWVGAAATLLVVAFIGVRLNIVIPGLAVPEFQALERAYIDSRLHFQYFPSAAEWLLTAFVMGLGGILFLLGSRYLPLLHVEKGGA